MDDILSNCTPETYKILLTNVTPINSIKFLKINKITQVLDAHYRKTIQIAYMQKNNNYPERPPVVVIYF